MSAPSFGVRQSAASLVIRYAVASIALLVIGLPILYGLLCAFKPSGEILLARFLPARPSLGNLSRIFTDPRVLRAILNSFLVCFVALALGCLLCLLASIPIARRKERIFGVFYFLFLSSLIIPTISGFVTLYMMMVRLRLVNSLLAVSVLFAANMLPIGVLIFSSFLKTVPFELEEAAKIEGCGFFRRIFLVVAPLITAPIMSLAVLQFPAVWNNFLTPLLFLRKPEARTLTLLIYNYTRDHESDFGAIFALLFVGMLIPFGLFLGARRLIEQSIGITAGGVKG
jgi:raffinose/stachyose/melibiose transport system permease protein